MADYDYYGRFEIDDEAIPASAQTENGRRTNMRLIDADAFAAEINDRQTAAKKWKTEAKDEENRARADAVLSFFFEVLFTLEKMPTVDAEPVVRCKDRVHAVATTCDGSGNMFGTFCALCNTDNGESFYCAHGKKRENVTDGFVRTIDDLGRIVIPKDVRKEMGISAGDTLLMSFVDGKVVIQTQPEPMGIDKSE